jgi:hypothetical protein
MSAAKSDILNRAICVLADRGPMTAGQVGLELWWRDSMVVRPGNTIATMFCRSAGKLLRRAEAAGLVRCQFDPYRRKAMWYANTSRQPEPRSGDRLDAGLGAP